MVIREHRATLKEALQAMATGRITTRRKVKTMFNPAYEIIGRAGQAHG